MSIASIATVEKYILRYSVITSLRCTLLELVRTDMLSTDWYDLNMCWEKRRSASTVSLSLSCVYAAYSNSSSSLDVGRLIMLFTYVSLYKYVL